MADNILVSVPQIVLGVNEAGVMVGVAGFGDTFKLNGAESSDKHPTAFTDETV